MTRQGASSRMGGSVCWCWAGPRQNNENMRNQGPLSWDGMLEPRGRGLTGGGSDGTREGPS